MIDLVNSGAVVHSEAIHSEAIQPLSTSDAADLPSIVVSPSFVRESNTLGPPQSPTLRAQQSNTLFRPATSSRPNIVEVQSSLGIRRLPSTPQGLRADAQGINSDIPDDDGGTTGRRRSLSAPQWVRRSTMPRKDLRRQTTSGSYLPAVAEGELPQDSTSPQPLALRTTTTRRFRSGSTSARSTKALQRRSSRLAAPAQDEYGAEVVDLLDVVGKALWRSDAKIFMQADPKQILKYQHCQRLIMYKTPSSFRTLASTSTADRLTISHDDLPIPQRQNCRVYLKRKT